MTQKRTRSTRTNNNLLGPDVCQKIQTHQDNFHETPGIGTVKVYRVEVRLVNLRIGSAIVWRCVCRDFSNHFWYIENRDIYVIKFNYTKTHSTTIFGAVKMKNEIMAHQMFKSNVSSAE